MKFGRISSLFVILGAVLAPSLLVFSLVLAQTAPQLQTTAISACAVQLDWTYNNSGNTTIAGFKAQRSRDSNFQSGVSTLHMRGDNPDLHSYVDEVVDGFLSPATTYYYRVGADDGATTFWSDPQEALTRNLPPRNQVSAPTNLTANGDDLGRIQFTWGATVSGNYDGYQIYRSEDNGQTFQSLARYQLKDNGNPLEYLDQSVNQATKSYSYKVVSFKSDRGCDVPTDVTKTAVATFSDDSTVIVVPASTTITSAVFNKSANKITINWTASLNASKYVIERRLPNTNSSFSVLAEVSSQNNLTYDDTNGGNPFNPNSTYSYRIKACSASGGCSSFSPIVNVSTSNAPESFSAAITSVNFTTGRATIHLAWNDIFSNERYYIIERAVRTDNQTPANSEFSTTTALSPSSVEFEDTVDLGTSAQRKYYTYRVAASFSNQTCNQAGDNCSDYAVSSPLNANLSPIKGWAWIGGGLGWIRLSNDSIKSAWKPNETVNPLNESYPYTVYLENDTNKLGGYAWSPYAGWLSFNEGCPSAYNNTDDCEAQVTGSGQLRQVKGFAKFIGDGTKGLNQWVSLSKKTGELASCTPSATNPCDYGLYYSTTTEDGMTVGQLRGLAWGSGPALGWITFGGPILKEVRELSAMEVVASSSDIIIALGNREPQGVVAELIWDNPIGYSKVEIWSKEASGDFRSIKSFSGMTETQPGQNKKMFIDGLKANTNYQFYVRGYLQ
jgi:hypothetical protein